MAYYVYLLSSEVCEKSYIGITDNLLRRVEQHNSGYHFFTKRYLPWRIIHYENYADRPAAREREKYLKSAAGRRWLKKNIFKS